MNLIYKRKNKTNRIVDFVLFPLRALFLIENDFLGLSSLRTERFYYVAREVRGRCLDIGCGNDNRFIKEFVGGRGLGIDVYKYKGLSDEQIVKDPTKLPYKDNSFDTVTLIANINHIPKSIRQKELCELYRVTSKGGSIIVTMGNPIAEILTHQVVWLYDKVLKTKFDVDNQRGMMEGETYYLTDVEIESILIKAGYKKNIVKKYFWTQWGLNHLLIAKK